MNLMKSKLIDRWITYAPRVYAMCMLLHFCLCLLFCVFGFFFAKFSTTPLHHGFTSNPTYDPKSRVFWLGYALPVALLADIFG